MNLSRRDFLKFSGALAGGIAMVVYKYLPEAHYKFLPLDTESLAKKGLQDFVPTYVDQTTFIQKYGSPTYPLVFEELRSIAQTGGSQNLIKKYTKDWGEFSSKEARLEAAAQKVNQLSLRGFDDEQKNRKVLLTISQIYPGLILACPNEIGRGNNVFELQNAEDKVTIPEILPSDTEEQTVEKLGLMVHELSHPFGGDFLNGTIISRIKPYITKLSLLEMIKQVSHASEESLLMLSVNPQDKTYEPMQKIRSGNISLLTEAEASLIGLKLKDGHLITLGTCNDVDVNQRTYDTSEEAIVVAAKTLISIVSSTGSVDDEDSEPGKKIFNRLSQ